MPRKKKEEVIEAVICEDKTDDENKCVAETRVQKPYFFPRLVAYIIDMLLVSLVCTGIMFVMPENKNYDKYMKEYEKIQTDLIEEKIDVKEYFNKSMDVVYDIDYSNVIPMIVEVVLIILYFVVFQFYNKGQTFGKKLMGIKVVSNDGSKLNFNSMVYRSLIIDSVFISFITFVCLFFMKVDTYYYLAVAAQLVNGIIFIATIIMVLFRKDGRGLHDIISGTKVVMID